MAASQNGHTETVNMLLEHGSGAEVHLADQVRNRIHNYTSCMCLCETGSVTINLLKVRSSRQHISWCCIHKRDMSL